ncbi:MAG: rhodanese-like domain-containing protein [Hydrogenimonas sp.]|nr:rhodanese-like domain-containing protein [Hydrogenimonas sp.]
MKKLLLLLTFLSLTLFAGVKDLDINTFEKLKKQGVPIIDIRTPQEWRETGIIDGSHTIMFFDPSGRYDLRSFLSRLSKLGIEKDTPFVLVCRSASRTKMLGDFLSDKLGYKKVYELKGGILNWKRQSKPLKPLK